MVNKLTEYLCKRNVADSFFLEFILSKSTQKSEFKLFFVNNQEYMISHFLDESNVLGHDLIATNDILKTTETDMLVFAMVEGDDAVCLNLSDNSIWLWRFESYDTNFIKIADSFGEFIDIAVK